MRLWPGEKTGMKERNIWGDDRGSKDSLGTRPNSTRGIFAMHCMLSELRTPKILHVLVDLFVRIPDEYQRRYDSDYTSGHYVCGQPACARGGGCGLTNIPSVEIVFGP